MKQQKLIVFGLSVAAMLLIGQVVNAAGYWQYDTQPCYDITGQSTQVLVGGVNNGGIMNFDESGYHPQYMACVRTSSLDPALAVPTRLEGWVWNDNLGWISLYCNGGSNLGGSCGGIDYQVNITATGGTPPDFTTVTLNGYAWGDNVGWIQFNDTPVTFHQVSPTASGVNSGLITTTNGNSTAHAWADSIGWLNLTGVRLFWYNTNTPPDIEVCSSPDLDADADCDCNLVNCALSADIPYADDDQSWDITVNFEDAGSPIAVGSINQNCSTLDELVTSPNGRPYAACLQIAWDDSVDVNQVIASSQTNASSNPFGLTSRHTGGSGAVTKALSFNDLANTTFNVRSVSPTSDQNITEGFANERFIFPPSGTIGGYDVTAATNGANNNLRLSYLRVYLFRYSPDGVTPGECLYGTFNSTTRDCSARDYVTNAALGFKPVIDIPTLNQENGTLDLAFMQLSQDEEKTLNYAVRNYTSQVGAFNVATNLGLADAVSTALYNLNFADTETSTKSFTSVTMGAMTNMLLTLIDPENPPDSAPQNSQPYLHSVVSYTLSGRGVSYWTNKLPRIKAGLIKNPVAFVKGNVYGTGINQKAADVTIKSLGNISSNLKREAVLRNVSKYTFGKTVTEDTGTVTINLNNPSSFGDMDELVDGKVYYVGQGPLTINCGGDCTPAANYTFIVNDGSIILQSNIKPTGNSQVGLIALKNLSSSSTAQGNLYIQANVTDVWSTHAYLDRLLLSCDASCTMTSAGWPVFADDLDRQEELKNQLRYLGTVSSLNGFGNAVSTTPRNEFGQIVQKVTGVYPVTTGSGAPTQLARARTADLNFLRYYGPGLELCAATNVPKDQQLSDPENCNPENLSYDIDANQLAPAGDLVSGDIVAGATKSAYYAGQSALNTEYPVYFEYQPIGANLAGFEVEQNFNPLSQ